MASAGAKKQVNGIVVMSPPPISLTSAVQSELHANEEVSSLSLLDYRERQRQVGRSYFEKGLLMQESYTDVNGVNVKRRINVKNWMDMMAEAAAWGEDLIKEDVEDEEELGADAEDSDDGRFGRTNGALGRPRAAKASARKKRSAESPRVNKVDFDRREPSRNDKERFTLDEALHKLVLQEETTFAEFCRTRKTDDDETRIWKTSAKKLLWKIKAERHVELQVEEAQLLGELLNGAGLV